MKQLPHTTSLLLRLIFLTFFLYRFRGLAQPDSIPCVQLKTGNFFYFSGSADEMRRISIVREKSVQKEIDGKDTTYFKTTWVSDCLLKLAFINSSKKMTKEEADFYRLHSAFTRIVEVKPDYYLFKGSLDSVKSSQTSIDTMWRR